MRVVARRAIHGASSGNFQNDSAPGQRIPSLAAGFYSRKERAAANEPHVDKELAMNRNTTTMVVARAMAICIAATLACSAAHASPGSLDESVAGASLKQVIPSSDLDLSKIQGAAVLYARIRHAARAVCETILTQQPGLIEKYRTCVDSAIADAVARANRPLLSQYHQLRLMGNKARLAQLATGH
jgi:UrcA family protein